MAIISISINDDILEKLSDLQKRMGFAGRSEIIRAGVRAFVQEEKQRQDLSGHMNAILMVVHEDRYDDEVARIKHDYEDLITTHLHNKIDAVRCVEVFVMEGEGKKIESVTNGFLSNKKMDTIKLIAL